MSQYYTDFAFSFGDDWTAEQRRDFAEILEKTRKVLENALESGCKALELVDESLPEIHRRVMTSFFKYMDSPECADGVDTLDLYARLDRDHFLSDSESSEINDVSLGFLRVFLQENQIDGYIVIEMAYYCSRLIPNEFGGNAVFITKDGVKWGGTSEIVSEWINSYEVERSEALK